MKKFILATVVAAATLGTVANAAGDTAAAFGFNAGIQTGSQTGLVFGATYKMANSDGNFFATFGANRKAGDNGSTVDGHAVTVGYQFGEGYTIGYRMQKTDAGTGHDKYNSIMVGMNTDIGAAANKNAFGCSTNLYTTKKETGNESTHDSFDMGLCTLSHTF